MNPESIVDRLAPLRTPEAVSWWPPAPGWWILALLLLAALALLLRRAWRWHQRGRPLRAARQQLALIMAAPDAPAARSAAVAALQRRVAIRIAGRRACAGLTGEAWAAFLNGLAPGTGRYFDATLANLSYQREVSADDCEDALEATQRWLSDLERPA